VTNNSSNAQVCCQCGTCTAICPVRRVVKFSPRVAIYDSNIYDTDTDVWDCLTCGWTRQRERVLITSCPKCLAHLNCLKEEEDSGHGHNYPFEVMDLTVYLARKLNGGDGDE